MTEASATITALVSELPRSLFQRNTCSSIQTLFVTVALGCASYALAYHAAWYSLPVCWIVLGALFVGSTFSPSSILNSLVGAIVSAPLLLPFELWRVQLITQRFERMFHHLALSKGWWLASGLEWLRTNFDVSAGWAKESRKAVLLSVLSSWLLLITIVPRAVAAFGVSALLKYWLMPWIVYHFWTVYRVPFTDKSIRLSVVFPDKYPRWLVILTNDIARVLSVSRIVSHAISTHSTRLIPRANVRSAFTYFQAKLSHVFNYELAVEQESSKQALLSKEDELKCMREQLDFGTPLERLPLMSREHFKAVGRQNKWVSCDSLVFDTAHFVGDHPGGQKILESFFGNDITRAFNGAVYNHSNGARNLGRHFLIARLESADEQCS